VIAIIRPHAGGVEAGVLRPPLDVPDIDLGTTASADRAKDIALAQPLIVALGVTVAGYLGLPGTPTGVSAWSAGRSMVCWRASPPWRAGEL